MSEMEKQKQSTVHMCMTLNDMFSQFKRMGIEIFFSILSATKCFLFSSACASYIHYPISACQDTLDPDGLVGECNFTAFSVHNEQFYGGLAKVCDENGKCDFLSK